MGCCGDKRQRTYFNLQDNLDPKGNSDSRPGIQASPPVNFQYTGSTALTAKGVITQKIYRFEGTGLIVAVDAKDATFMTGIPNLRRVR